MNTNAFTFRSPGPQSCFRPTKPGKTFNPADPQALDLLTAFQSDKLYIQLCKSQECFRARLTPKPWRVGMDNPPRTYPWISDEKEQQFNTWSARYDQAITKHTACQFIAHHGEPTIHPDIQPILTLHDQLACDPQHQKQLA